MIPPSRGMHARWSAPAAAAIIGATVILERTGGTDGHPTPPHPLSPNWKVFGGLVVAAAMLKEVAGRLAESPLAVVPKRPSATSSLLVGLLLKAAVGRIGSSVMGPQSPA